MKKLLISILIILLLVLCGFAVTKGYNIGDFTVLGVETIKRKKWTIRWIYRTSNKACKHRLSQSYIRYRSRP